MVFQIHPQLESDSYLLGYFQLCQLRLINDQQFPWFILVPQVNDINEIYQLDGVQQSLLWQESSLLSVTIMRLFKGDKLNLGAIGNVVPQLHLHHVVRYKCDPCWPKPIWGQLPMQAYSDDEPQKIKHQLAQNLPKINYACAAKDA